MLQSGLLEGCCAADPLQHLSWLLTALGMCHCPVLGQPGLGLGHWAGEETSAGSGAWPGESRSWFSSSGRVWGFFLFCFFLFFFFP